MRKLKTRDIPAACRCIKRLGVKDELLEVAQNADSVKDAWSRGFEFIWRIFDLATEREGETEIYTFLAGPFELTPEEVGDMDMADLIAALKQLAAENDLKSFFDSVAKRTLST